MPEILPNRGTILMLTHFPGKQFILIQQSIVNYNDTFLNISAIGRTIIDIPRIYRKLVLRETMAAVNTHQSLNCKKYTMTFKNKLCIKYRTVIYLKINKK
jgi:hypothetical protein